MLSLATIFMWLASVMAMFVNLVVGQPITNAVEDRDLYDEADEDYRDDNVGSQKRIYLPCTIL